jgi:Glycosyl hydrolases family 43
MTALLPARAPTPSGPARDTSSRRHIAHLGMAALAVVGYAWPVRGEVAPTTIARHDAPSADVSLHAAVPSHQTEAPTDRPPRAVLEPRPLAPEPPPDGRDAPDPFILADGGRYLLYNTQVGFHNVPVATSPNLRDWSPPTDALPRLPQWAERGRTWAPGVMRLGDRYLLYFAPTTNPPAGNASASPPAPPPPVPSPRPPPNRSCAKPTPADRSTPTRSSTPRAPPSCCGKPTATPSANPARCSHSASRPTASLSPASPSPC